MISFLTYYVSYKIQFGKFSKIFHDRTDFFFDKTECDQNSKKKTNFKNLKA